MFATVQDATLYVLRTQDTLHNVKSVILHFVQNAISLGILERKIIVYLHHGIESISLYCIIDKKIQTAVHAL